MYRQEPENGWIRFYYDRDVLFNDVSLMSNFMAKNLTTKDGDSLTDDYAISDDEKDMFGVCLQQTLPDIYESMAKITNGISSAFEASETGIVADEVYFEAGANIPTNSVYLGSPTYDATNFPNKYYTLNGSVIYLKSTYASGTATAGNHYFKTSGEYVTFILQDNAAYNTNVLSLVDASLLNAIKIGTLKEFYSVVIQADFFKVCTDRFLAELYKLKQRLFQFKKKTIVSNLT